VSDVAEAPRGKNDDSREGEKVLVVLGSCGEYSCSALWLCKERIRMIAAITFGRDGGLGYRRTPG
jgi:hypothetical protein